MSSPVAPPRLVVEIRWNATLARWEAVPEGGDGDLVYYHARLKMAVVKRVREMLRRRWRDEQLPSELKVRKKNGQYSRLEATYGNDPAASPG